MTMPRIQPLNPNSAPEKSKELLNKVKASLGFIPNLMATLAHSPVALDAYLTLSDTLKSTLDAKERELISVVVADTNQCDYCAAAHTAIGKMVGLTQEAIDAARNGTLEKPRHRAVVELARQISETSGQISQSEFDSAISSGLSEQDIADVVANVALNFLTNSFNNLVHTEIDEAFKKTAGV